jgi:hypothetical protein
MKKFRLVTVFSITVISIAIFLDPVYPNATTAKSPCRIEVSMAHISKYIFLKTGKQAVKVDAFSKCNVAQSKVTLTVELWKVGNIGNHLVVLRAKRSPGVTLPGRQVENFTTFMFCKNNKLTNYYGVAYSKAFIAGKWQFARHVLSQKIVPIECGT